MIVPTAVNDEIEPVVSTTGKEGDEVISNSDGDGRDVGTIASDRPADGNERMTEVAGG